MKKFGLFVLSSFVTASASAQILNGGFEDGLPQVADNWVQSPDAAPYTYDHYVTLAGGSGSGPGLRGMTFNGNEAPAGSTLSQTFTSVPGLGYDVSFLYGNFGLSVPQILTFSVINVDDSAVLATGTFTDDSGSLNFNTLFNTGALSFVATGSTTQILMTDAGSSTGSTDLFVDSVVVTPVPEPASMAVLGLGLAALRKRSARK